MPSAIRAPRSRPPKLHSLEMLRAIAALLVILFHIETIVPWRMGGTAPFGNAFSGGYRGVDLFFVLSGFIIATVHGDDIGRPARLANYLFNRLTRIYPAVWIMTALAVVLYGGWLGAIGTSGKLTPWSVIAGALLLPQHGPPLVNVTWTLKYELFFYALFAVTIANRTLGFALIALWQAATVVAWALGADDSVEAFYLHSVCLEFSIGLACAWWLRRPAGPARMTWAALLAVGVVLFTAGVVKDRQVGWAAGAAVACALGAGAIIAGLARLESLGAVRVPPPLVAMGGASYAIYLVHFSAIMLLATVLAKLHVPGGNVAALVLAAFGIAAGFAFDRVVDRPIQRWLRDRRAVLVSPARWELPTPAVPESGFTAEPVPLRPPARDPRADLGPMR